MAAFRAQRQARSPCTSSGEESDSSWDYVASTISGSDLMSAADVSALLNPGSTGNPGYSTRAAAGGGGVSVADLGSSGSGSSSSTGGGDAGGAEKVYVPVPLGAIKRVSTDSTETARRDSASDMKMKKRAVSVKTGDRATGDRAPVASVARSPVPVPASGARAAATFVQNAVAMRYSRFYEVGFAQALTECAERTKRGPLTAVAKERAAIENHALEIAFTLVDQLGEDGFGKINGNDNPKLVDSKVLGTRGNDVDNGKAFRELQQKLTRDYASRWSVIAISRRASWTQVTLHKGRPYSAPKISRMFDNVLAGRSVDSPELSGITNSISVATIRHQVTQVSSWTDESICEGVLYGRVTPHLTTQATTWSFDGSEQATGMARYLKLLDEAMAKFAAYAWLRRLCSQDS